MGEPFSATFGSETPEPIKLKFCMIDYVQHTTSHAKIETRRFRGIGYGRGEVAAWHTFFSCLGASTEQSIERGSTLNASQNVFWWYVYS